MSVTYKVVQFRTPALSVLGIARTKKVQSLSTAGNVQLSVPFSALGYVFEFRNTPSQNTVAPASIGYDVVGYTITPLFRTNGVFAGDPIPTYGQLTPRPT